MKWLLRLPAASLFIAFALGSVPLLACPNCKESVSQSGSPLATGYAISIVALIALPVLLIGIWCFVLYRLFHSERKVRSSQAAIASQARS